MTDTITAIKKALEGLIEQAEHVCLGAHTPCDIRQSAKNLAEPLEKANAALSTLESLKRENEGLREELTGTQTANQCMTEDFAAMKARAEAAEADVKRYREALHIISAGHACPIALANNALRPAALSSTGDTHGN